MPDLNSLELGESFLAAYLRVAEPPIFSIKQDQEQALYVEFPIINLLLQAHLDGEWTNYFHIKAKVNTGMSYQFDEEQKLVLKLLPASTVEVEGRWDESYTPNDPGYDESQMKQVFEALFELAYTSDNYLKLDVPTVTLGRHTLGFGEPHTNYPFIETDILK